MLNANCFALVPAEKSNRTQSEPRRFAPITRLLLTLVMLAVTFWQIPGTAVAQDSPPASETESAESEALDKATDKEVTEDLATPTKGETKVVGLDERIDKAFKPIADFWGDIVFYPAKFGSTESFQKADTDQDGKFNAAEYEAFSSDDKEAKTFAKLDKNEDDLLTPAEAKQQTEVPFIIFVFGWRGGFLHTGIWLY